MPADGGMQGGSGGRGEAANQDDMTESLSAVLKALISLLILFAPVHPPYVYVKPFSRRDSSLQNIFHERECKQWIIKLMHSKMIANNPFNPFESDGQTSFKKVEKRGSQDSSLCHGIHFPFMLLNEMGFFPLLIFHLPGALAGPAAAALSQEHTRFRVTWSHLYLSVCLCCRTEQFQESQWRRMKTPGEGTGETRLSLSSPVWAMLWAWAMSGGFHTSATEMEEVSVTMTPWAHYLCIDKLNYSVPMFIIWYRHWFLWNIRSRIYYNCSINEVQICKRVAISVVSISCSVCCSSLILIFSLSPVWSHQKESNDITTFAALQQTSTQKVGLKSRENIFFPRLNWGAAFMYLFIYLFLYI